MRSVKSLRSEVRKLRELQVAARMLGDRDVCVDVEGKLSGLQKELGAALLKEAGYGVSKEDEPTGKPKGVPEGNPRKG